jgi:hypothetical protein
MSVSHRAVARATLGMLTLALAALATAAAAYPGGTQLDRQRVGYSLLGNFLCDLQSDPALDGRPNPVGARLLPLSLVLAAAALAGHWWLLAHAPARPGRAARWIVGCGLLSSVSMACVPLLPALHLGLIVAAVAPGAAAASLGLVGLAADRPRRRGELAVGSVALLLGVVDGIFYAQHDLRATPVTPALPALERLASLLLCAWVTLRAVGALRQEGSPGLDPNLGG